MLSGFTEHLAQNAHRSCMSYRLQIVIYKLIHYFHEIVSRNVPSGGERAETDVIAGYTTFHCYSLLSAQNQRIADKLASQ